MSNRRRPSFESDVYMKEGRSPQTGCFLIGNKILFVWNIAFFPSEGVNSMEIADRGRKKGHIGQIPMAVPVPVGS